MRFELGSQVKWKHTSQIRLGYAVSDIGRVVGIHKYAAQDLEIDVQFGGGEVLHGAVGEWFEPVADPAGEDQGQSC